MKLNVTLNWAYWALGICYVPKMAAIVVYIGPMLFDLHFNSKRSWSRFALAEAVHQIYPRPKRIAGVNSSASKMDTWEEMLETEG
jgi:hypothetical protein